MAIRRLAWSSLPALGFQLGYEFVAGCAADAFDFLGCVNVRPKVATTRARPLTTDVYADLRVVAVTHRCRVLPRIASAVVLSLWWWSHSDWWLRRSHIGPPSASGVMWSTVTARFRQSG